MVPPVLFAPFLPGGIELALVYFVLSPNNTAIINESLDWTSHGFHFRDSFKGRTRLNETPLGFQSAQPFEGPVEDLWKLRQKTVSQVHVLFPEKALYQLKNNESTRKGSTGISQPGEFVGQEHKPGGKLQSYILAVFPGDRKGILPADVQEPFSHDDMVRGSSEPGIGDDSQGLSDQRLKPELSCKAVRCWPRHRIGPKELREDTGNRPFTASLRPHQKHHFLLPGISGQAIAEPFFQGLDTVWVIRPKVGKELEPLNRAPGVQVRIEWES